MTKKEDEQPQKVSSRASKAKRSNVARSVSGLTSLLLPFCNGEFEPVSNDPVIAFYANSAVKERAAIVRMHSRDESLTPNAGNEIGGGS